MAQANRRTDALKALTCAATRQGLCLRCIGHQLMPAAELFDVREVVLRTPVERLISRPGRKAICAVCGEEIMNEREVVRDGLVLCRACAGESYYDLGISVRLPVPAHHVMD